MFVFEKSSGAIVFRRTENGLQFLLLQYIQGHWGLPKGHIEGNETHEETLRREVLEETGITDIEINSKFSRNNWYFYRARNEERKERIKAGRKINILKKVTFYLAETKTSEITLSDEHQDFKWLSYSEALEKITFRNTKMAFKKAFRYLPKD